MYKDNLLAVLDIFLYLLAMAKIIKDIESEK